MRWEIALDVHTAHHFTELCRIWLSLLDFSCPIIMMIFGRHVMHTITQSNLCLDGIKQTVLRIISKMKEGGGISERH